MQSCKTSAAMTIACLVVSSAWNLEAFAQTKNLDEQLLLASRNRDAEKVTRLLEQGADPNAAGPLQRAPLHFAANSGDVKLMKLLIEKGADVNAIDDSNCSVLREAVGKLSLEPLQLLLDAGAKPTDDAMHQAGWLRKEKALTLLLEKGGSPNAALVGASHGGHVEIVKLLLEKGAKANARNKHKHTALHLAALQGGPETVRLLLKHGADPNAKSGQSETPLHTAIKGDGNLENVKLLVAAGARVDTVDQEGVTPVRLAGIRGNQKVYAYLQQVAREQGEPPAGETQRDPKQQAKSTPDLLDELKSRDRTVIRSAQQELAARGKQVMPEIVNRLKAGESIEPYLQLFTVLGPQAEAAMPYLYGGLADKKQVFGVATTLQRMQPTALQDLPADTRKKALATLYEAIIDPMAGEMAGWMTLPMVAIGEDSAPYIVKFLESENARLRMIGASALESARFDSDAITTALVKIARDDPDRGARGSAIRALAHFGKPSPAAREVLLDIISSPPRTSPRPSEAEQRVVSQWKEAADQAAQSLARYSPEVVDELVPLLGHKDSLERIVAIAALQASGDRVVPQMMELLAGDDPQLAMSASVVLQRTRRPAVVGELAKGLSTDSEQTIQNVCATLWMMGPSAKAALPDLYKVACSKEHSDASRVSAARAALKIDPARSIDANDVLTTIPAIIRLLDKGSFREQLWAAETARSIGPAAKEALPSLQKRLDLPGAEIDTDGLPRSRVQEEAKAAIAAIEGT